MARAEGFYFESEALSCLKDFYFDFVGEAGELTLAVGPLVEEDS